MRTKLLNVLRVPADIRTEFWQESLQKNKFSLFVVSIIVFIVEPFNMARVLFWSKSGLGTVNNRIYFTMYCILLSMAVLWHLLVRPMRGMSQKVQWWVQYSFIILAFLWLVVLNAYDLTRDPKGGTTVYITAVLSLGSFIQMSSAFSIILFVFGYSLFYILTGTILDPSALINLTITTGVALSVSLTISHQAVMRLKQQKEINGMNARLKELAQQDPLTELLNKTALENRAVQYLNQINKTGSVVLLILDLDNFKGINDNYGHPCGDYVLLEMALKLKMVFLENGVIGRIGGDEFAVVLSGVDKARAESMGEQMLHEISDIRWHDKLVGASLSIGICQCNQPGVSYKQLYQEADLALYEAKNSGKGRCCARSLGGGRNE